MNDKFAQAQEHYERGNQFDEAGDAARAMDEWKLATQLNPNHFEAHYNLAIAYADAGDLNAAIPEMDIAYGVEPEDQDVKRELLQMLLERGDAFIAQKDAARATQDWERALELDSANVVAHLKLGQVYADKFADGDAEAHLNAALSYDPYLTDAYDKLAEIYLAENRKQEAINLLRKALNIFHSTSRHHSVVEEVIGGRLGDTPHLETLPLDTSVSDLARDLADLQLEAGDPDQAMAALEQAEPEPDDAAIWRDIAQAFQARGDAADAEIARNRAAAIERGEIAETEPTESEPIDASSESAEEHFEQGEKLYAQGEIEKAFEEYSEAVRLNPDHADAHYSLGIIYQDDEEFELAAKEFRAVLHLDPNNEDVHARLGEMTRAAQSMGGSKQPAAPKHRTNRDDPNARLAQQHFDQAELLYARGKFDQARAEYQQAVHFDPDHGDAHYSLGLIAMNDEDYPLAEKEFREAFRIDPNSADAHVGLGSVFDALEDWQSALSEYRAALESDPDHPDARENLIWDLLETNALTEAQKELKHAKLEAAAAADLWEEIGKMHEERSEHGSAIAAYERAVELNSKLRDARAGLKRLGA